MQCQNIKSKTAMNTKQKKSKFTTSVIWGERLLVSLTTAILAIRVRLISHLLSLTPHAAPGLKRIAVTLRLRRPRSRNSSTGRQPNTIPPSASLASQSPAKTRLEDSSYTSSSSLIRHLIDLFYTHASFMFPWESKATILSDMEEDAASACLIYCMCAIGAR